MSGKLPPKVALEREFLAGASYAELARKYGVTKGGTVLRVMKKRAMAAGTRWPLKRDSHLYLQRHASLTAARRWDSVTGVMVGAELRESRFTVRDIWRRTLELGEPVGEKTIYTLRTGSRERCSRETARRIMKAIESLELSDRRARTAA